MARKKRGGKTNAKLSRKISHLVRSGRPQKQAVAIAFSELGLSRKKRGKRKKR